MAEKKEMPAAKGKPAAARKLAPKGKPAAAKAKPARKPAAAAPAPAPEPAAAPAPPAKAEPASAKPKPAAASGPTLRIRYVRSAIGTPYKHKLVVKSLGFKRLNQIVTRVDTPAVRGMVAEIPHLVTIVE